MEAGSSETSRRREEVEVSEAELSIERTYMSAFTASAMFLLLARDSHALKALL